MTYHLNWNLLWNRSLALFLPSCELNEIYIQFNRIGECNQVYAFDSIAREIEREKKRIHLHSVFIFQSSMFCSIFTYNNADTHMEFCSHTEQFAVTMPMSTTSWELIMLMRFSHYYKTLHWMNRIWFNNFLLAWFVVGGILCCTETTETTERQSPFQSDEQLFLEFLLPPAKNCHNWKLHECKVVHSFLTYVESKAVKIRELKASEERLKDRGNPINFHNNSTILASILMHHQLWHKNWYISMLMLHFFFNYDWHYVIRSCYDQISCFNIKFRKYLKIESQRCISRPHMIMDLCECANTLNIY